MSEYVNNHIHTIYSFSPYTPTDAVRKANENGLTTAGIMDHDSVSGALEFLKAGHETGIGVTIGFECRCSMKGTPYESVRVNNPDQIGVAYVACHGIPARGIQAAANWLAPYRAKRGERNRKMTERLNAVCGSGPLYLDYDADVVPLSQSKNSGSVTERHLLYALTQKILSVAQRGEPILALLSERYGLVASGKNRDILLNVTDPYYDYRLLGVLKSALVERFYIDADEECPPIAEFVEAAKSFGAIPAYPYLGDVADSVTGDKKPQTFEDSYLDGLMPWLKQVGFLSVTYMPTRNSQPQLQRLMRLCEANGLFQICGEDINTPFQPFVCEKLAQKEFAHLVDAAWALIGHEKASASDPDGGMFSGKTIEAMPTLTDRIARFAAIGKESKP